MAKITAMVESPKGYNQKFDYDLKSKRFKLSKVLPAGLVFPYDFGMIPGTKGEDGDPLDIILISECTSFPGCLMDCRIIGAIKAEQTERDGVTVRNDRYIGIPQASELFKEVSDIGQLPPAIISQIEAFFENYNKQAGKKFRVVKTLSANKANKILRGL